MGNLREYKAAVALNNMAVSLVKGRSFRDAAATFKDALKVIRLVNTPKRDSAARINQYLNVASNRLALPKTAETTLKSKNHKQEFEIRVLSESMDEEAVDIAVSELPSNMLGNILRIDDCDDYGDEPDVGYANAIILHNFATMCRWKCWTVKDRNTKARELQLFAFKFFTKAYSVLCNRSGTTTDDLEAARLTILTILVLQNMMNICFQLEVPWVGLQYYDKLCGQRSKFLKLERLQPQASFQQKERAASQA